MTEKPARPATKRASTRTTKTKNRKPDHSEISERAYYIHLEDDGGITYRSRLQVSFKYEADR